MLRRLFAAILSLSLLSTAALAGENLLVNGDFESGLTGWSKPWARSGKVHAEPETAGVHGGKTAVRLEHDGSADWSFPQESQRTVQPGQIYELSGWVRIEGDGKAELAVVLFDSHKEALYWSFAARTAKGPCAWRELRTRFVVPPGAVRMWPRWIGHGPVVAHFDDTVLAAQGAVNLDAVKRLPKTLSAQSPQLEVTLRPVDATLTVRDRRGNRDWTQSAAASCYVLDAKAVPNGFDLRLLEPVGVRQFEASVRLDPQHPEITVEIRGVGEMLAPLQFPQPFASPAGTTLIMPVNEGMSYPVDDSTLRPMHYYLYGGHGLCMGWYGITDGAAGLMTIVETPDDASVNVPRLEKRLQLVPQWEPQKGQFGPARRLRYVFLDQGGYVAMCKRYRQYAQQIGLLKTLTEKRKALPLVDRLVGAVNVWCWGMDAVKTAQEMQSLGMKRLLWSSVHKAEEIDQLNAQGLLTSRYDIYQDVMDPANFPKLRGKHSDWPTEAWPHDIMFNAQGDWIKGWGVDGKDGVRYPCGVLCDRVAPDYARRRIPPELQTKHYGARFIDTTTASPWRECYNEKHPLTRSESKHWKMELLRVVSEECKLVTGCETGHEASVPYLHFFEGMMSLGPYRVHDAGRKMPEILDEVPEQIAKFQTGHFYRLPLWELVYHDCTVSYWYWGDYNNKLPKVWDRRDLWNALYGTPPMFMFTRKVWEQYRERFVESYRAATPVARATGYAEMLSHRWLTADHAVQETRFADGTTVTVNFGDAPHRLPDGTTLGPLKQRVTR